MLDKILRLGKETAIYGLSTVAGRLFNFLIVPLYANALRPEENGAIANIYAYIAFANVVYGIGMEQAFMRFYSRPEIGDKRQIFTLPFLVVCGTSLVFSFLLWFGASAVAPAIGLAESSSHFIRYASGILFFDAVAIVPFALLRMEQQAKTFALLKLLNIIVNLSLNIVLIVVLRWGIEGVFAANLIASLCTAAMLWPRITANLDFSLPAGLLRQLVRFGLPLVPAGFAGIALQVIDRPLVKAFTGDAALGIYQLNYRLGIFMMLVVGMFDYAWRPFFLKHAGSAEAKSLFARVFTLLVLGLSSVLVVVSLFIGDLVRVKILGRQFFPPVYWSGLEIVPWVLLAYVFTGMYTSFVVGVYLERQTKYIPLISGIAALLNVIANIVLLPRFGILGAAWATTLAYAVMALAMFRVSQRYYPIAYEWQKIFRITLAVAAVFILNAIFNPIPLSVNGFFLKSGFVAVFFGSLFLLRVVSVSEFARVGQALFASAPKKS